MRKLKSLFLDIFDMLSFLVFVWWIVLFVRFFIAQPYTVVWASMAPTFEENDFIVVDKVTNKIGELKRWDVIVFVPPGKDIPYIKRIVWLPWEKIKIQENKVLVCNKINEKDSCTELNEPYLEENTRTDTRCGINEFTVSQSWLFVMWDNRWFSTDSRCCFGLWCYSGTSYEVPFNNIVGKVLIRFFPNTKTF